MPCRSHWPKAGAVVRPRHSKRQYAALLQTDAVG